MERFSAKCAGVIAKDDIMALRDVIRPGKISPFERVRDISKLKESFGSYNIKASGLSLNENLTSATISNVQTTSVGKDFRVTGTYQATGKAPCRNPTVIVTGYDASGKTQEIPDACAHERWPYKGTLFSEAVPGQSPHFYCCF